MKNPSLKALVIAEATKLKKNATKEELYNLNFKTLDSQKLDMCIYGQMTGNCFNTRATTLIRTSCKKVFNVDFNTSKIGGTLNGSPLNKPRREYWSPIEVFIDKKVNEKNGNNKRLIRFLKGETKTLKFR